MKFSNVPVLPSHSIYLSQLHCICCLCTGIDDFNTSMQKLTNDFLNKGFSKTTLKKILYKFIDSYEQEWAKFGQVIELPITLTSD